jgi:hypothetical protein
MRVVVQHVKEKTAPYNIAPYNYLYYWVCVLYYTVTETYKMCKSFILIYRYVCMCTHVHMYMYPYIHIY